MHYQTPCGEFIQDLRTVEVYCLLDEVGHRVVEEMTFERVPAFELPAPALDFQLHERTQGAEKMVADGGFPAHEELLGVADLLNGPMVALDGPVLLMGMHEVTVGDFHPLFFRGSYWA